MSAIDALRAVNFDWAMHLKSVWSDPGFDVADLHGELRTELNEKLDDLTSRQDALAPLGWVIVGSGGTGKTHLLSILRRESLRRKMGFVLVDMTDVHDFWDTVLLGYLNSLQQPYEGDKFQHEVLLELFIDTLHPTETPDEAVHKLRAMKTAGLAKNIHVVLTALRRKYPVETMRYQDVIRALISLNSADFNIANVGLTWLQGHAVDDTYSQQLGFTVPQKTPIEIVRALSWVMSLAGPTVLAFDQLDPIVAQLNIQASQPAVNESDEEETVARSIIENIAGGLGALRDITQRTLSVVSCVESTWGALRERIVHGPNIDRFESPRVLGTIVSGDVARAVVQSRLASAYLNAGFEPPHPTWPFCDEAFEGLQGLTPREVLKRCHEHRRRCLARGEVVELHSFDRAVRQDESFTERKNAFRRLDETFEYYRQQVDASQLLEEKLEDDRLAPLLQTACSCLVKENPPVESIDPVVDIDFHGGKTTRALHARLRLVYHDEGDREEHFCLRALQRKNACAFQARLKAAMTQSGIDKRLRFRRLVILRRGRLPGGKVTGELVRKFESSGGVFHEPSDDELRTLWALDELRRENDAEFFEWLRQRKPTSQLPLLERAMPVLTQASSGPAKKANGAEGISSKDSGDADVQRSVEGNGDGEDGPARKKSKDTSKSTRLEELPLGRRLVGGEPARPMTMPVKGLEKHTVILAGAGSGKTVLLRRLVEEVALLGIPSIVIDCANDLATLGDSWPQAPTSWQNGDAKKAEAFHAKAEVVIWTPGRETGNPLTLEPLPDLAGVADDQDLLDQAVEMSREALRPIVAPGATLTAQNKAGVLSSALKFLAHEGGGPLERLVELLADLPTDAGLGIRNETRLAREMSDRLRVEMETNVLLRGSGSGLDPAILFGDTAETSQVRVSVINFVGLQGLDTQRQFLNQLAMTLFSWIKKNPSPPGRPLRGLLVIDEAKDFVPARGSSSCKASLMRLTAQARKYHLGLIFATQNPREIENTIIGNCSTQYYGKASSPAAIDVIRDQIRLRGGSGDDVGGLQRGHFYVHNADVNASAPVKVVLPLCLSQHPANPLEEEEILSRAGRSRRPYVKST